MSRLNQYRDPHDVNREGRKGGPWIECPQISCD
jgi:hypothetical protein